MSLAQNTYGQRDIQAALLAIVKEVDRVCRAHGIEYSIYGGTLLGAVREGGFIPWDDDLDLVFTRDMLERLVAVFPHESATCTITHTDTWVTRAVPREPVNGEFPFVDLFHYAPISADQKARSRKLWKLRALQGMLKENIVYRSYTGKNRLLVATTHLLGLPFSKALKLRWYRHVSEHAARGDGTLLHVTDDCFAGLRHLYPHACVERYEDVPFEDTLLCASAQRLEMLRIKYGERYMTPPPEAERKPSHTRAKASV
ncbi:MAG: LicD family protein [Clostridia bacterium]